MTCAFNFSVYKKAETSLIGIRVINMLNRKEMKTHFAVFGVFSYLSLCSCCIAPNLKKIFLGSKSEYELRKAYLEPAQLISKWGYPSETHTVQTEDGYLLSMHRIPYGIRGKSRKGPVFLQHGFLGQSLDWLLLKPQESLAFLLADRGYDVWLGNFRGNTHSRAHKIYTPCEDSFWDFTWHESGMYDVSAMIDHILKQTNSRRLEYIGHSMGTTAFLVLMSMRPEYNGKISKAHLMAPVAVLKNTPNIFIQSLSRLTKYINLVSNVFTTGPLFPDSEGFKLLKETLCNFNKIQKKLCTLGIFLITGADSEQFDKDLMGALLYHYPAGYSNKALNHYSQVYLSGEFRQYDYGEDKNKMLYGRLKPPSYSLEKITAPIALYSSLNDYFSTPDDALLIQRLVPSIEELYVVKNVKFNHLDFIYATDAKIIVYDEIIKRMKMK